MADVCFLVTVTLEEGVPRTALETEQVQYNSQTNLSFHGNPLPQPAESPWEGEDALALGLEGAD